MMASARLVHGVWGLATRRRCAWLAVRLRLGFDAGDQLVGVDEYLGRNRALARDRQRVMVGLQQCRIVWRSGDEVRLELIGGVTHGGEMAHPPARLVLARSQPTANLAMTSTSD